MKLNICILENYARDRALKVKNPLLDELDTNSKCPECLVPLIMFLICLLQLNTAVAQAGQYDDYYYANLDKIIVYETPAVNGKAYDDGLKIGYEFIKTAAVGKTPAGWIPVRYSIPGDSDLYEGWLREKDTVSYRSFSKVTKDWPVRYYCYWRIDGQKIDEKKILKAPLYRVC